MGHNLNNRLMEMRKGISLGLVGLSLLGTVSCYGPIIHAKSSSIPVSVITVSGGSDKPVPVIENGNVVFTYPSTLVSGTIELNGSPWVSLIHGKTSIEETLPEGDYSINVFAIDNNDIKDYSTTITVLGGETVTYPLQI
ncbi:MAG: hypothetical protein KGH55_02265 [Nanoarchaeota archaeon]|nr:hypothetical protein [Nanoarchaeota archaeon]